jgi:FkbM family methyltransferase
MVDIRDLSLRYPEDHKAFLETLLSRNPTDGLLLDAYCESLDIISHSYFGIITAIIPEVKFPLFFRANSSDIWNFRQIFQLRGYDFEFPRPPMRILDLGAYAGYAAVYFANRFPNAEIVCVEPNEANFEVLRINTVAYPNVKLIHGAVWHNSTRLHLKDKMGGEAWACVFEEREGGAVQAYSVGDLLKKVGWVSVDYVKCDIEGAEVDVFSDPSCAEWLSGTSCVSVEMHDRFRPGCTETVQAALSAEAFERHQSGEYSVFVRRQSPLRAFNDQGSVSKVVQLGPTSFRPLRFRLINVHTEPWGFMIIDENTFQLHPNNPGEPPAEMEFAIDLSGQNHFSTGLLLEGFGTGDVIFSVTMGDDSSIFLREERQIGPGEVVDWVFSGFPCFGRHRITLATRMAPNAKNHGGAWARWVAPTLK